VDWLNYVVTNFIPRRLAGRFVGWISHSENPVICAMSLWIWRRFTEIDLSDAERIDFRSMHDCFTRRLKPGARLVDPDPAVVCSPCDAIVGAFGTVVEGRALQVKGMGYGLGELVDDPEHAASLEGATFVTLRLTSAMYHRFHAPCDLTVRQVRHVFGDCWNVNPPTLRRVARLFCRNERVVVRGVLGGGAPMTLVAVAAILVSGIRLGFLPLEMGGRLPVRRAYDCDVAVGKGAEMGWFEHGSTIIVLAPAGMRIAEGVREGGRIRMGQALLRLPDMRESVRT
jgi:phosphatidylserine decarboxylase